MTFGGAAEQGRAAEVLIQAEIRAPDTAEPDWKPRLIPVSVPAEAIPPPATPRGEGWRISRSSVRIFGQNVDFRILLLASADWLMLAVSIQLASLAWPWSSEAHQAALGTISLESVVIHSCIMVCLISTGLYKRRLDQHTTAALARVLVGFGLAAAIMMTLMYLARSPRIEFGELALVFLIAVPLLGISRAIFVTVLGRERFARRVLVYGCGNRANELRDVRVRQDLRRYKVIGFVPTDGGPRQLTPDQCILPPGDLREFVMAHDIDEVVVAMDDRRRGLPVEQLLNCRLAGVPVTDVLTFIERESGKVELSMFYPSWLIFSEGINQRGVSRLLTRVFDLLASLALFVLTLPFAIFAALAIWVESGCRGSVLYSQQRVGLNGRKFVLHKFRSMEPDAEKNGAQWACDNDPRVTRVGCILRKTHLDEVPQLFNVLKGDMSFVGPRPERPEFVEELSRKIPYYRERHCVKPGITGWAQLSYPYGASEHDALEKLQYDLYYLKHKSLLFDLVILLQTAEVVLWRRGGR